MTDIDTYNAVRSVAAAAKVRGIDVQFSEGRLYLFRDGGSNRAVHFTNIADAQNWLNGYDYALEWGREPGSKLL